MILEKGVSPNVVRVKLDCSQKKEHWFLLLGDQHWDNPKCDRVLLKKHLDEALEYDAGILDCGDLFCAMQGAWDPRKSKNDLRPEHQTGDYFDALVRTAADFYEPYAHNIVSLGQGNHECHDDQTEVLTDSGWKLFRNLGESDLVGTMSLTDSSFEWQRPTAFHSSRYKGDMVLAEGKTYSFCVTPNHDIVYRSKHGLSWKKASAEKYSAMAHRAVHIPVSTVSKNPEYPLTDDEITFAGILLTDGSVLEYEGKTTQVLLFQAEEKAAHVRGLLDRLGYDYRETETRPAVGRVARQDEVHTIRGQQRMFRWNLKGWSRLRALEIVPTKKHMPDWCTKLSHRQARVLFDAIVFGDGSTNAQSVTSHSIFGTKESLDRMQIVALQHGFRTSIREYRPGEWLMNICDLSFTVVHDSLGVTEYDGMVFCCQVPNGTLVTRRNGKVLVSGNSNILKRNETNLTERLAQSLRDRTKAPVPVTGYTGWVKFQFVIAGRVAAARTLWHMHGYGGGGPVTVDNIQAQRQNAYVEGADIMWSGHCFSQDTEILTPNGWKTYDQLVIGSEVATMNKQTRKLEFQPVSMVHKHYGYDKMVSIKGQGTDLLVTADHGLVYTKRRMEHELRECKASEFQNLHEVTIPSSANYDGPGVTLSDDEIRLAITVVADGNITEGPIRFHYVKERKVQRTCEILDNLDIPYSVHVSEKTGKTKINVPIHDSREWLTKLGIDPKDKRLPDWIYHVSRKQALVVLHEYRITDGYSSNGTHMVACSTDKRNMDAVQSCAVKCGRRTSLRRGKKMYRLNVATKSGLYFAHARSEEVPHDGSLVWCVTVPNGTLIVRRNGCVTVTQNTHDRWAREFCKVGITQEGEVFQRNLWYVKSGSYKNEYNSGKGGWHVETGKPPKPLGGWWLKFTFFKKTTKGVTHSNVLIELIPTS